MLLLISDRYGIYIPQHFAELVEATDGNLGIPNLVLTNKEAIEKDLATLANPDDEWYWEAFESVCNNAIFHLDGKTMYLHQDGDLWLTEFNEEDIAWLKEALGLNEE